MPDDTSWRLYRKWESCHSQSALWQTLIAGFDVRDLRSPWTCYVKCEVAGHLRHEIFGNNTRCSDRVTIPVTCTLFPTYHFDAASRNRLYSPGYRYSFNALESPYWVPSIG